jgi:transcription elongation factor Elf1
VSDTTKLVVPPIAGESGRVRWAKREGEPVARGDVVLEVDLGFLKVPIKAPCPGTLTKRLVYDDYDASGGITVGLLAREKEEPRPPSIGWISMECTFHCRACGFDVPLDSLDMDGAVVCVRCGLEQAFEVRAWHDAFDVAHAVADGTSKLAKKQAVQGENVLRVTALPHAPRCATCEGPVEVAFEDERARADCKACATSIEYVVPPAASRMTKNAIRAVLADAHRKDAPPVKTADSAGAVAIQCPSCSAALDADASSRFVSCKYCKTKSRIPERTWFRLKGGDPKPVTMWIAFEGESRAAREAERAKEQEESDALAERIKQGKRAAAQDKRKAEETHRKAEREHAKDAERAKREEQDRAEAAARAIKAEREAKSQVTIMIAVPVVILVIAIVIALVATHR